MKPRNDESIEIRKEIKKIYNSPKKIKKIKKGKNELRLHIQRLKEKSKPKRNLENKKTTI